jgi:creatinine amidohydrolase
LAVHRRNIAALTVAVNELAVELHAPIATTTYFLLAQPKIAKILKQQTTVRHACEAETSMVLALAPELVDMSRAAGAVGPTEREVPQVTGTEAAQPLEIVQIADVARRHRKPRSASAERGEKMLDAATEAVARLVTNREFWTLSA